MKMERPDTSSLSRSQQPRVYLAGPDVFLRNAMQLGELKKALCAHYGFEGVFPMDAELDIRNCSPREAGFRISSANEALIRECELLIANITPFRGPSADVGTAYEMGVARGIGLIVFAYSNVAIPFTDRTVSALDNFVSRDTDGRLRDSNGMAIEEWGLIDNLMLEGCIHDSGGMLVIENVPQEERFTHLGGFEQCLQHARSVLRNKKQSSCH